MKDKRTNKMWGIIMYNPTERRFEVHAHQNWTGSGVSCDEIYVADPKKNKAKWRANFKGTGYEILRIEVKGGTGSPFTDISNGKKASARIRKSDWGREGLAYDLTIDVKDGATVLRNQDVFGADCEGRTVRPPPQVGSGGN